MMQDGQIGGAAGQRRLLVPCGVGAACRLDDSIATAVGLTSPPSSTTCSNLRVCVPKSSLISAPQHLCDPVQIARNPIEGVDVRCDTQAA